MKPFFWAVACVVLCSSSAQAQTVCATTTPVVVTADDQIGFRFCHTLKDQSGDVTTMTYARVVVDGIERFKGMPTLIGGPTAAGEYEYETPKTLQLLVGSHTAQVSVANATGEGPPATLTFTVGKTPTAPVAPVRIRVVK